jgi:hypothetical protein
MLTPICSDKMSTMLAWFFAGLVLFSLIIIIILYPPIQVENFNEKINNYIPGCDTFDRTMEKTLRDHGKTVQTLPNGTKETHYINMILPSNDRRICLIIVSKDAKVEVRHFNNHVEDITDIIRQTPSRNIYVAALESSLTPIEVRAITTSNIVPRFQLSYG